MQTHPKSGQAEGQESKGRASRTKGWKGMVEAQQSIWQGASGSGPVYIYCTADEGKWEQMSSGRGEGQVMGEGRTGVRAGQEGAADSRVRMWQQKQSRRENVRLRAGCGVTLSNGPRV